MLTCMYENDKALYTSSIQGFIAIPSTRGRNRTGTNFRSSVFETDASTNSATRAYGTFERAAKIDIFSSSLNRLFLNCFL
jgi:hypothetical protein